MSGILGVFGPGASLPEETVRQMIAGLSARGTERVALVRAPGALLAVGRFAWEQSQALAGPARVAAQDGVYAVADAAVYYRRDLLERLAAAGVRPGGDSPADLVLAAYLAWGDGFTDYLEGDYTAAIWDPRRGAQVIRDPVGRRPLYRAVVADTLIVASTLQAVLAYPDLDAALDLTSIGAAAAGLHYSLGDATPYAGIRTVCPARQLCWSGDRVLTERAFWTPTAPTGRPRPFEEAAEELRDLLIAATRERIRAAPAATVWMSGGWDSTAVFAAGREALRRDGSTAALTPVSISYPANDPGHEDPLIRQVASHWRADVQWIRSDDIDLFAEIDTLAAGRGEAAGHLYDRWGEALAVGTRAAGAHIALDGNGGDQLFRVSDIHLHDLYRQRKWWTLAGELWSRRTHGRRYLVSCVRGEGAAGPGTNYAELPVPQWIRGTFLNETGLVERERAYLPKLRPNGFAAGEIEWFLTLPAAGWGNAFLGSSALRAGVELRGPLLDRRIIDFALTRPIRERSHRGDAKLLLRAAMRDLLPTSFLGPRSHRTGTTVGLSRTNMQRAYPGLFDTLFRAPLELERLGVIDSKVLDQEVSRFLTQGGEFRRVNLFHTLQVELWLRSREHARARGTVADDGHAWTGTAPVAS